MKKNNTRQMVRIATLSAIAVIFYMFEFRVIPGSPLKVDLSDFPVLIAGYTMGVIPGMLVALLKNILHALFIASDGSLVGELANLAFAIFIMLPITFLKKKNKKINISIYIVGVLFASFLMHFFNYFVTFPLYQIPANGKTELLLGVYLPFNVVKAIILYIIFAFSKKYFDSLEG